MSLIPSESENFPDSFRSNVGWRVGDQPDDPKAAAAVQRLVEVSPPAESAPHPEATGDHQTDTPPQPNPPAPEEGIEIPSQPAAMVADPTDVPLHPAPPL